jgi:hypothetical protein
MMTAAAVASAIVRNLLGHETMMSGRRLSISRTRENVRLEFDVDLSNFRSDLDLTTQFADPVRREPEKLGRVGRVV